MGLLSNYLVRVLPKGRFVRNVATLAGGTFAAQAIMVIAAPVTTRLYSPADYGILAVFTSIVGILLIVAAGRYELAITVAKDDESALNILGLSICLIGTTALLTAIIVWLAGDTIAALTKMHNHRQFLWFLPLSVVAGGTYQVLNYWSVRTKRFGDIARTKFNQSIGSNTMVLAMGLLKTGPIGLLLGLYMSNSAGIVTLARPLLREYRSQLHAINRKQMRNLLYRYRRFPLMSAPSALLNSAAFSLPPVLLSAFYGTHEAGLYGLAMRVVGLPSMLVGTAISQVFLSEIAQAARENPTAIRGIFRSVTKKMLKFSLLVVAFGSVSPYVFGVVFGQQWQTAGLYCAFLSFHAAAQIVVSPISTVATVVERQDLQVIGDLIRCVLVGLSFFIPYTLHLSATVAIASYTVTMLLTYIGFYFMYRWIAINCGESSEEVT